jgi:hypothetical protein
LPLSLVAAENVFGNAVRAAVRMSIISPDCCAAFK